MVLTKDEFLKLSAELKRLGDTYDVIKKQEADFDVKRGNVLLKMSRDSNHKSDVKGRKIMEELKAEEARIDKALKENEGHIKDMRMRLDKAIAEEETSASSSK